ncbi:precorrin-8X methylmutase [Anaerovorax odorimutans]|uniref:Precorrin-8X methylmutase n=1 Tax=Anaerovorax odorimutans TaxID=109327 RepID=A0ABT1RMF5_9FIRM|nr:precorrin-8X methylmutase [Anaerovorax odorimutans]MCQ4636369.1 precorrin-8X methylmutase [Anaerovorax odorimutans]
MENKVKLQQVLPDEIEKRSFEIISQEIGNVKLDPLEEPIIKRVIHTSADFDYLENLVFSPGAAELAMEAVVKGATIVTDTNMAMAGINKKAVEKFGGRVVCFMADEDVRASAKADGTTRAAASMKKAAAIEGPAIFAIGNAPTALAALYEMIAEGTLRPALIIGVPVGFVNVVEAKELIMKTDIPYIVARGRKGGSNVAAAICNAILYQCGGRE